MDESYLKLSLFGIVVKVTPEVIAKVLGFPLVETPSMSELEITYELLDKVSINLQEEVRGQLVSVIHTSSISSLTWVLVTFLTFSIHPFSHKADICKKACILLSQILHWEPINLESCILDEMIVRGDPSVSKKEVIPYGILITKICQRVGVEFLVNFSFLKPIGPINTSYWNRSQGQIEGALGSKKKACCRRAKIQIGEDPSVLAQLWARFDALDEKIYTQSTLLSEQISQLHSHMERGFSLIDGQMLCNMDQLQALEDFVHKHLFQSCSSQLYFQTTFF